MVHVLLLQGKQISPRAGQAQESSVQITSFNVPGIRDRDAAESISDAVRPAEGVEQVIVNVPARLIQVTYDEGRMTAESLKAAIEASGFRVQRYSDGEH